MLDFRKEDIERFWSHVDIRGEDDCWNWMIGKYPDGYGKFRISFPKRMIVRSHRFSYIISNGQEITSNQFVCHSCDNPLCVNPKHLWLGTAQDNTKDRDNKNRQAKGMKQGTAKVNEIMVLEIRKMYEDKKNTIQMIADKFNISFTQAKRIAIGESWKHIEGKIENRGWKIKLETINKIIELYKTKNYTQEELAKMFNIGHSSVSRFVN